MSPFHTLVLSRLRGSAWSILLLLFFPSLRPSRERRIDGVKLLVSHSLDECLHPWALRLGLSQLPVEIRMCIAIDAVFW